MTPDRLDARLKDALHSQPIPSVDVFIESLESARRRPLRRNRWAAGIGWGTAAAALWISLRLTQPAPDPGVRARQPGDPRIEADALVMGDPPDLKFAPGGDDWIALPVRTADPDVTLIWLYPDEAKRTSPVTFYQEDGR